VLKIIEVFFDLLGQAMDDLLFFDGLQRDVADDAARKRSSVSCELKAVDQCFKLCMGVGWFQQKDRCIFAL